METLIKDITELKIHGRTTDRRDPLTPFWTASGFECNVSGSELWVEVEVTYRDFEPWFSYTINGDWVGRQMLTAGRYWVPLFRGMNPDKIKNVHFYKDLQAMSDDPECFLQIHALRHDGVFYPVPEKALKLEFIGDSITSGEGLFGTNDANAFEQPEWVDERTGERHKMHKNTDGSYNQEDIRAFRDTVVDFLHTLRECNPRAQIIWCYGMLGTQLEEPIRRAIADYTDTTDDKCVSYLQLPCVTDATVGSRQHPGYRCHREAAEVLIEYIRGIL